MVGAAPPRPSHRAATSPKVRLERVGQGVQAGRAVVERSFLDAHVVRGAAYDDRTREGILKAIAARHAYAATDNIVLRSVRQPYARRHLRCGGQAEIEIRIEGTAPVEQVDVVRNNKIVFTNKPGKASVQFRYQDADPAAGESYYYVRVQQRDGQMAWSSPMWIGR